MFKATIGSKMSTEYKLYIDKKEVTVNENKRHYDTIGQICKNINENASLLDRVVIRPFNYYDDENTSHKPEPLEYHNKICKFERREIEIVETWNSMTKTIIHISLSSVVVVY